MVIAALCEGTREAYLRPARQLTKQVGTGPAIAGLPVHPPATVDARVPSARDQVSRHHRAGKHTPAQRHSSLKTVSSELATVPADCTIHRNSDAVEHHHSPRIGPPLDTRRANSVYLMTRRKEEARIHEPGLLNLGSAVEDRYFGRDWNCSGVKSRQVDSSQAGLG